jgi:hypothetical protein
MKPKRITHLFCGSEAHATLCGDWCGVNQIRKTLKTTTCRKCLAIAKHKGFTGHRYRCTYCHNLHQDFEEC